MRIVNYRYPTNSRGFSPALNVFARSPWTGLEGEIDRLFQAALSDFVRPVVSNRFPVDVYEDKDNTYVRAELPGVNRSDISIEMADGYLTITAEKKTKDGEREESFSLNRSVAVSDTVQTEKVAAIYENGVLTVTLPKKEEAKPRKINVTVN